MGKISNNEIKDKIGNSLIEMMEKIGEPIWHKPWIFASPEQAFQGDAYKGVNQVTTSLSRIINGQRSHLWLTKKKIDALAGWMWDDKKKRKVKDPENKNNVYLRKGCHGVPVIYWNYIEKKDDDGNIITGEDGGILTFPMLRYYFVYNADDVLGFDFSGYEPQEVYTECDTLSSQEYEDKMLSSYVGHPIMYHGGNRAFYAPYDDTVTVPEMYQFDSSIEYASTLAHELGHSTGHKTRLNRKVCNQFGDEKYSKEELVAEFTSAMVLATLGIRDTPTENNAAYLKHWLSHIKKDPKVIYDAISDAKKACDMITGANNEAKKQKAQRKDC